MRELAVVMRTMDRVQLRREKGLVPEGNYLEGTLQAFARAGVFRSPHLHSFYLVDSGSEDKTFLVEALTGLHEADIHLEVPATRRTANLNAARALELGAASGAPWVLFCEDDLDVCDALLESIVLWLSRHARDDRRLYAFGSAASEGDAPITDVAIEAFYGSTCYAIRREDAASMVAYVTAHPRYCGPDGLNVAGSVTTSHDLQYCPWSRVTYPEIPAFAVAVPCFVQHVGAKSGISTREHEITYKNWPGREWRYL